MPDIDETFTEPALDGPDTPLSPAANMTRDEIDSFLDNAVKDSADSRRPDRPEDWAKTEIDFEAEPADAPEKKVEEPKTGEKIVAEPPKEEPTAKPAEPAAEDDEKEILRLKLVEAEAEQRRLGALLGEHGGRMGFLEKQLSELKATRTGQPADTDSEIQEDEPAGNGAKPATRESVTVWAVTQAIGSAVGDFSRRHAEVYLRNDKGEYATDSNGSYKLDPAFQEALAAHNDKLSFLRESDDPVYVTKQTEMILDAAHAAFTGAKARQDREFREKRQADQSAGIRAAKQEASTTSSTAAPKAERKPRTLQEVDSKDLNRFLDRHFA